MNRCALFISKPDLSTSMAKIWELLDEAKEAHEKMREAWDERSELSESQVVGWIDQNLHILTALAQKVEELEERMNLCCRPAAGKGKKK